MTTTSDEGTHSRDVIVSINEGSPKSNIWKGSSYDFGKNPQESGNGGFDFQQRAGNDKGGQASQDPDDPPSQLIGQFLHKQKASGDFALDMDLEMDELRQDKHLASVDESPTTARASKEHKVTFHPPIMNAVEQPNDAVRRRYRDSLLGEELKRHLQQSGSEASPNTDDHGGEVVRCTSNASYERTISFQRKSSLLKTKTKSRLLDPPDEPDRRSGRTPRSGQIRSGFVGRIDEEEEDPFMEEDLPEDFNKSNFNALTLLQWVSLILIVASLICTLCIPYLRYKNLWQLRLWKWEVMVLVLICGRLVSGWGIRIIVFFVERNFLLRKKILYFVYGVRRAVQNCLWLGLVLIAWHFLFDKKVQTGLKTSFPVIVTKILICLLVGTLVWLVKTLLVKVLASCFHVSTYFDRIQESLFNQFVIETLSGPPVVEMRKTEEEEEKLAEEVRKMQNAGITIPPDLKASAFQSPKSGRVIGSSGIQRSPRVNKSGVISREPSRTREEGITIDQLHKLNPENVSAWNMKRLMNIIRHGSITTLDEHAIDSASYDESATQIRSENEAKAAAKKIFQNVARRGCRYIYLEDLLRFMREDEAAKTICLFEGALESCESGKISKSALKNWVVQAFRDRRALALTLNDTKTAVNRLHRMLNFLVGVVIFIIWLLILGIATSKFLVVATSQLVVAAFIFGNTCKTIFEAIIFLFVIHPFDVGDRCDIDGIQMVVEEMKILTTVFLRYDNMKVIIPNGVLSTKPIHNYYRSPDMGDAVEFCVHVATPAEKIAAIKQRISSYVDSKKEHWYPNPLFFMKDVEELNRLRIAVWLVHRMTYQDIGERWVRRGQLIEEMSKIFRELDLQYRLYPTDINIRAVPTAISDRLPASWAAAKS